MNNHALIDQHHENGEASFSALEVLHALQEPVVVMRSDCSIDFVNHAFQEFCGIGEARLLGQKLMEVFEGNIAIGNVVERALTSHDGLFKAEVAIGFGSDVKSCDVSITPVSGKMGEDSSYLMTFKLKETKLNIGSIQSLKRFSLMLAHEVKNPLSGIQGAAQLLSRSVQEKDKEFSTLIFDEAKRIQKLVDQMSCFADDQPIKNVAVNIHEPLDRVKKLAQLGFASHVNFIEDLDPSLPEVKGDVERLTQVFINVFKNAAEAMPEGSEATIRIKTFYSYGKRENGRSTPVGICIQDAGTGVLPEQLEVLLDPFYSTKSYGTGLGLSVVAKIIEDHGGQLEIKSNKSQGTSVYIYLPIYQDKNLGERNVN